MLNDRRCKIVWKKNSVPSNVKVGMWKCSGKCQEICAIYYERFGWKVDKEARKSWITQEMISKMDERRKWKNDSNEEGRTTDD